MVVKKHECKGCKKFMRSDNLRRHQKICKEILIAQTKHEDMIGEPNIPPTTNPVIKIEETDSEELKSDDDGNDTDYEEDDYQSKLQRRFQHLYTKFNDDIENLHFLLSKLQDTNCLTYKECKGICEYFIEKIDNF